MIHIPSRLKRGMEMRDNEQKRMEEPEDVSVWWNIGKKVFLVIVLVAAWLLMDWLMGGR
jgi:hypothetical protein